jgi:hypothetical protein
MRVPTSLPRIKSTVFAIDAIECRLDDCPAAAVAPPLRAALNRLLGFPVSPNEFEAYEPGYAAAEKARHASFERNLWVMENVLLSFVSDCEAALPPMTDEAWMESLHDSMLRYLRTWFGLYSREHRSDETPIEIGDWTLCRLAAAFQTAYTVDPWVLPYQPLTPEQLVAASALLI